MDIFSYGTLLDAEYQRELFGRTVPTRPAELPGWLAVFTESGYLTIVPDPGAWVRGAIVSLDAEALAVAEAWEEVPLYVRTSVVAREGSGAVVACHAYVRPSTSRDRAAPGRLARHSRAEVVAAIRAFRAAGGGHASVSREREA